MNKHEYISRITKTVAEKSTCDRARVGAVFVTPDYEILSTGYNSSPKGFETCDDVGHLLKNNSCIRTVHAEQNAITQAAKRGVSLNNSFLYVTHNPCNICTKLILNLGVTRVLYENFYRDQQAVDWLKAGGLEVLTWEQETERFKYNENTKLVVPSDFYD